MIKYVNKEIIFTNESILNVESDVIVIPTNERLLLNGYNMKYTKLTNKLTLIDNQLQNYLKEHYLEGCLPGYIKPAPINFNRFHNILFYVPSENLNVNVLSYIKCLSFIQLTKYNKISFQVDSEIDLIPMLCSFYLWYKTNIKTNFVIELCYNRDNDVLEKYITDTEFLTDLNEIYNLDDMEDITTVRVFYNYCNYLLDLRKDNKICRNEIYPYIDD